MHLHYTAFMSTNITIRDVPDGARDILAERAARSGRSLQQYLRAHLVQLAQTPEVADLVAQARSRLPATRGLTTEMILAHRDAERG